MRTHITATQLHPQDRPSAVRVIFTILAAVVLTALSLGILSGSAQAASPTTWNSVSAGTGYTCGIHTSKSLFCWGYNGSGQLGDGTTTFRTTPRHVGSAHWSNVTTGTNTTCGITTGDSLYCWGLNNTNQIGDGTTTERHTPRHVGSAHWSSVAVGDISTCGITTSEKLYCWGQGANGALGTGGTSSFATPHRVGTATNWVRVTSGTFHVCALNSSHQIFCWGYNGAGQIGNGSTVNALSPLRVGTKSDWASIDAGALSTCGIRTGGRAYCWGENADGELADNTRTNALSPTQAGTDFAEWSGISAGGNHTCAIRTDHALGCTGLNSFGELGLDDGVDRLTFKREDRGYDDWHAVSAGRFHTCAIRSSKALYCWGDNGFGQLGIGAAGNRFVPTRVS
jgi:alpha-tubulin suppressor-like RCC1 family protein